MRFIIFYSTLLISLQIKLIKTQSDVNELFEKAPLRGTTRTHRTNFCKRHQQVGRGEIKLENALEGLNLSVAIFLESDQLSMLVLDELVSRAKFHFEDSYAVFGNPPQNETFTDLLIRSTNQFDIAATWWVRTIERLNAGIIFPESWYDADTIIVWKKPKVESKINIWAFAYPFTPWLWGLIGVTAVISGFAQYFLDYLNCRKRRDYLDNTFTGCIFFIFHAFTGHVNYTPKGQASKILTISICFLSLILKGSFTANLANFFITEGADIALIFDINDVVYRNLLVCSRRAIVQTEQFRKNFPRARLKEFDTEEEMFLETSDGICDVCLTTVETYKTLRRDVSINKECDLEWVGRRVEAAPASFALSISEEYCSSLLHNALDLHFLRMKKDGTLAEIWNQYRDSLSADTCTSQESSEIDGAGESLTVYSMSGIFAFHLILVTIALMVGFCEYCHQPKEVKQKIRKDIVTGRIFTGVSMRIPSNRQNGIIHNFSTRTFRSTQSWKISSKSFGFGNASPKGNFNSAEPSKFKKNIKIRNSVGRFSDESPNVTFDMKMEPQKREHSIKILERTMYQKKQLIEDFHKDAEQLQKKINRKNEIIKEFKEDIKKIQEKMNRFPSDI